MADRNSTDSPEFPLRVFIDCNLPAIELARDLDSAGLELGNDKDGNLWLRRRPVLSLILQSIRSKKGQAIASPPTTEPGAEGTMLAQIFAYVDGDKAEQRRLRLEVQRSQNASRRHKVMQS